MNTCCYLINNGKHLSIDYTFGTDKYKEDCIISFMNSLCDKICMEAVIQHEYDGETFSSGREHHIEFPTVDESLVIKAANNIAEVLCVDLKMMVQTSHK